ncbi:hypothetical protein FRC02_011768 [Tulasnella sp. 418]|nr:hypothetical protein FRC02_011768 [Tulasnella sp. 418]
MGIGSYPRFLLALLSLSNLSYTIAHHEQGHASHQHQHHSQQPLSPKHEPWTSKYGQQIDLPFTGPLSFAHLPYTRCLDDPSFLFDIAILGMPFDTAVTYRPGARFGPYGIRSGSRRQREIRGYTMHWKSNPYAMHSKIVDCGDVPISPFDNALALDQIETAYSTLVSRPLKSQENSAGRVTQSVSLDSNPHPRIVTLGGDHTIVLPILRSLHRIYGPISVIHFDSHLDTWPPTNYPGSRSSVQSQITHGTFFWKAAAEGLIASNSSVHAGIRCKLTGIEDLEHDESVGFQIITTDDIDDLGIPAIVDKIRTRVGNSPVYLSFDIDVVDPSFAPATGTPEAGGWSTREVKRILRGLAGLNFVGFDLVEVAPAYDSNAEITGVAAADLIHEFLSMLVYEIETSASDSTEEIKKNEPRDEL